MAYVTREQAMTALFTLLQGAYAFGTTSRRPMTQANLPGTQMPAMFLIDDDEDHKRASDAPPAVRTITCAAWIFTDTGQDPNATPATILNNIIDSIDPNSGGVLMPSQFQNGRLTLGNLVYDCWIEGKITKDPGVLGGNGFAHIPISIMLP